MCKEQMQIVITMAGRGSRFREAGYTVPKYRIEARGHSLFEWSMKSLAGYGYEHHYIFLVRREDAAADFIRTTAANMGMRNVTVMELERETDGQATTALLAASRWEISQPLLIYNIDTFVEPMELKREDIDGDGFIPCFRAAGNHWSFVRLDEQGNAVEVREKERISEHCTLGAYYFRSCGLYQELYREYYEAGKFRELTGEAGRERYVAPLYNYLIAKGGIVKIIDVNPARVHVLGTPEELQVFINE